MKNKLVEHLDRNGLISDYQAGFTRGRRLEFALVRALKYYKCDPRLIEIIVDIYMGDRTERWTEDGGQRGDRGN